MMDTMNFSKTTHRMPFLLLSLALTVFPGDAWAVQSHGAPEGLYVHQLAHIFFLAAMCYLFWGIRQSAFSSRGWRLLQIFCVFMVVWNIVAFTGHALVPYINSAHFIQDTGYLNAHLQGPFTSVQLWYYFTKLDHLFSVPALFFLYLGMKNIYHSSTREDKT